MEITQVRAYRDAAQFTTTIKNTQNKSSLIIPEGCIPGSILALSGDKFVAFIATYNSGTSVEVEFSTQDETITVSWLTAVCRWEPLYKIVEIAPWKFITSLLYNVTNASTTTLRFGRLFLHSTSVLADVPRGYETMAVMRSEESIASGEGRTFEVPVLDRLDIGTTLITGETNDSQVDAMAFVVDISREGEQHPPMYLIVNGNQRMETPAGNLSVHKRDGTLIGMTRMPDLAPGQKTYIEVAKSRKLMATVTTTKKTLKAEEGTILKEVNIKVKIENRAGGEVRVLLALPDLSITKFIGSNPSQSSLGWTWTIGDVGKEGGRSPPITYYQTIDRR